MFESLHVLHPVCDITRYSATQPRRGRSDVTLVTDATATFGSDGMKATASNSAMYTDAAEVLMSQLPTRNG
jgi:hypothetical protein